MAVYRNIRVRIPRDHITIQRQKGGPAVIRYVLETHYDQEKGYATARRITIGHQCEDSRTEMYPTTGFATVYPELWKKIQWERAHLAEQVSGKSLKDYKEDAFHSPKKQPAVEAGTVSEPNT